MPPQEGSTPPPPADALPGLHTWSGRPTRADLEPLPTCPAVYLLIDGAGASVQLATTQQLKRLCFARLADPDRPRRGKADLAEIVRGVRWRPVYSSFEARWHYYLLARALYPQEYRRLISFGPAWFLNVDWEQAIPEVRVTERIWCVAGELVGPWPTRAACQQALESLWDLFDLCRYPEQVRAAPRGRRCAYAEMGRCDAPCDGSAALDAYVQRHRAAWRCACGSASEWIATATGQMKAAAAAQQYERAGQLKEQLALAHAWQYDWSRFLLPATQLNYFFIVPVTRRAAWKPFIFRQGHLADGPVLRDRQVPEHVLRWLGDQLARRIADTDRVVRMEQTWLVAHFLYRAESARAFVRALPTLNVSVGLEMDLRAAVGARRRGQDRPPNAVASPSGE